MSDWFAKRGGAAFPVPHINEPGAPVSENGMSQRDWFAGQALPAVIAVCGNDERNLGETMAAMFARKAYGCADALIAAMQVNNTRAPLTDPKVTALVTILEQMEACLSGTQKNMHGDLVFRMPDGWHTVESLRRGIQASLAALKGVE